MGIREKYPFPSEEDYQYRTQTKQGSKLPKFVLFFVILGSIIIIFTIVGWLFFTPTEVLYSVEGLPDLYKEYLPLLLWLLLGMVVFLGGYILNLILMPWNWLSKNKKPDDYQGTVPIECGETEVKGAGMVQFGFQYYPYALIYIIFDIVGVFLMLWALLFGAFGEENMLIYFAALVLFFMGPLSAFAFWERKAKIKWS
ncbi:MAG: NADH-quinone oxidoreductase subunit A [Promethearchaeota archaeon]